MFLHGSPGKPLGDLVYQSRVQGAQKELVPNCHQSLCDSLLITHWAIKRPGGRREALPGGRHWASLGFHSFSHWRGWSLRCFFKLSDPRCRWRIQLAIPKGDLEIHTSVPTKSCWNERRAKRSHAQLCDVRASSGLSIRISPNGLPPWLSGKRIHLRCRRRRRRGFDPWVGKIPWRRKWQPTPVFLPEKPHGQRNLAGYSPKGHKESDVTERLSTHFTKCLHSPCTLYSRRWAANIH